MASKETEGKDLTEEQKQLLNRQIYAFGYEAQSKISKAKVLLVGLKGLGVEIAKNVVLAGVGAVGLCDDGKTELSDLGSQFFLHPEDVGTARATASQPRLAELNKYCQVSVVEGKDFESKLSDYTVVCMTETNVTEQVRINTLCREKGVKFISGDIRGLLAAAFVDLGAEHVVTDMDGEREKKALVVSVSNEEKGLVTVHEDTRHGLSDGDWVTFMEIEGMTELNDSAPRQVRTKTPFSFTIEDTTGYQPYSGNGGYFIQVKVPQRVSFKPLSATLQMDYPPMVEVEFGRSMTLHCLYLALSDFETKNGSLPKPDDLADAKTVVAIATAKAEEFKTEINADLALKLARCSSGLINPMAAFLGGILGQEVLKACSGKFTPIQQHLYFDAVQVLPSADLPLSEYKARGSRYDHQIAVIGHTLHQKLQNQTYFLIGAGAIGCEMLKNWALMGIATGQGKVTVTDMDVIETSNLSRQFLFRPKDVQSLKSEAAARAIKAMNPDLNIESHSNRVGREMENVYNDAFWKGLSGAITALDNVQARIYVDQKCVEHSKFMLDSGTLGTKGNTQCVIPHLTEMYGSSRDPPEEGIPVCTLKNFPNKIEHTIAWARDKFEGRFANTPQEAMNYISSDSYLSEIALQPNTEKQNLETVLSALVTDKPSDFADCIRWARLQFQSDYTNQIKQLLAVYPENKVNAETGARFWSGQKRPPSALTFDMKDEGCMAYVVAAANLRAFNYGIASCTDEKVFLEVLPSVQIPDFKVSTEVKIAANDEELKEMEKQNELAADHDEQIRTLVAQLPSRESLANYKINAVDFEKDDDTNFHMDFITACSNLRARNYKIKEESKHQTKFIAGKIIPAIATTTAMVTGLVCLELYKTLQPEKKLEDYRNSYANLAVSLFAISEPFPPPVTTVTLGEGKEWKYTLWDTIDIKGPLTLGEFMNHFEAKHSVTLDTLTFGSTMLVSAFSNAKKLNKLKQKDMLKVLKKKVDDFHKPKNSTYLSFEGVGMTEAGEAVELPTIRYFFK